MSACQAGGAAFQVEGFCGSKAQMAQGVVCEYAPGRLCVVGPPGHHVHVISVSVDGWHPTREAAVAAYLTELERSMAIRREAVVALLTPGPEGP